MMKKDYKTPATKLLNVKLAALMAESFPKFGEDVDNPRGKNNTGFDDTDWDDED